MPGSGAPNAAGGFGAVYVFYRDEGGTGNWGEVTAVTPVTANLYGGFGETVPLVAGSPGIDDGDTALAPLTDLAEATTGNVVRDAESLDAAVRSLAQRLRITYQVPGPPETGLHEVSATVARPDFRLRVPGWGRSATPETVAAARVPGVIS